MASDLHPTKAVKHNFKKRKRTEERAGQKRRPGELQRGRSHERDGRRIMQFKGRPYTGWCHGRLRTEIYREESLGGRDHSDRHSGKAKSHSTGCQNLCRLGMQMSWKTRQSQWNEVGGNVIVWDHEVSGRE